MRPAGPRPRRVRDLHHTPTAAAAPLAGPLDEVGRAGITRRLTRHFGPTPTLAAHVALLDTRGAWYAARVLPAWPATDPDAFFGLVRHVVGTQLPGPVPDPDIEGWIAAGRPGGALGGLWDAVAAARYPDPDPDHRHRPCSARPSGTPAAAVTAVDRVLAGWPAEHLEGFVRAYAVVEALIDAGAIRLPHHDG